MIGETLRTTIELFFDILSLLILARILLSFVPQLRENAIAEAVYSITEPILRPFQRLIPPLGAFDLSPIVAILALGVIQYILLQLVEAAFGLPA